MQHKIFTFIIIYFFFFTLQNPITFAQASFEGLGHLPGGAFDNSIALGVSADGSTVVGYGQSANGTEAFLWTDLGGMIGLGDLPNGSFFSHAEGASADGSVVVGYGQSANGTEAFLWTALGGMVGLGDLPGGAFFSIAYDVTTDGSVVVGVSATPNGAKAFRWENSVMTDLLGNLPGGIFSSIARGTSADGSIVVGYSNTANGEEAFLWTASGGMRSVQDVLVNDHGLDLTGWTLTRCYDISDDGYSLSRRWNESEWRYRGVAGSPCTNHDNQASSW